jgi:aryl-alcohol dehydrogenase-like predicted oxidoreductase
MDYRKLGETGLVVSEIGFGTWGIGGNAYGHVDDIESRKALRVALETGINFFDTADLYGNGHSEELLGEVFSDCRDRVIIGTKGGMLPHTTFDMPQDFSPQHIVRAIDESLQRLRTDYIDLYLLHSPSIEDLQHNKDVLQVLETGKSEGKIRSYGISTRSPQDAIQAVDEFGFDVVEVNFNMIDQRALDSGFFDRAKAGNIGVIVRTPLTFGYLTGKLHGDEQFESLDHRANWPKNQLERWAQAPQLFSFLYKKEHTPAQTALRFCLDFNVVSTVIPGMMNVNEVLENAAVSEMTPLTKGEMTQICAIYKNHEFYDKTAKQ